MRPRKHYGVCCSACGSPIVVDAILPDDVWQKIARGDYALCPPCIDDRLIEEGMHVVGLFFYRGKGLSSDTPPADVARIMRRPVPR